MLSVFAGLLLAACGGDDDNGGSATATQTTAGSTSSAASPTGATTGIPAPGSAGIASHKIALAGLNDVEIDEGWAMFAHRDASEKRTGVTDDSIKICRPVSLTGAGAVWGSTNTVFQEEIKRLNDAGGIFGRKIDLVIKDDASSPAQAAQVVHELIEQEGCFMIFAAPGTGIHNSFLPYLTENNVPDFNAFVGGVYIGEPGVPNATSGSASGLLAGFVLGSYIYDQNPNAKVAIIYQDDDTGRGQLHSLQAAAAAHGAQLVATQSFQPAPADLSSEVQAIVDSGATDLYAYAIGADWPKIAIALRDNAGSDIRLFDPGGQSVSSADLLGDRINGLVSAVNEAYPYTATGNAAVQAVNQLVTGAGGTVGGFAVLYGQTGIENLFRALACAGPDLTRESFIEAVNGGCFDGSWKCSVCLGPAVITPEDRWMAETYMFQQWDSAAKSWKQIKEPKSFETSFGDSVRGNIEGYKCSDSLPCPWKDQSCTPDNSNRCAWKSVFER